MFILSSLCYHGCFLLYKMDKFFSIPSVPHIFCYLISKSFFLILAQKMLIFKCKVFCIVNVSMAVLMNASIHVMLCHIEGLPMCILV